MNIEKTELSARPKKLFPQIVIGAYNFARSETLQNCGIIKNVTLKTSGLLFELADEKNTDTIIELSSGTSEYNLIKDFGPVLIEEVRAKFNYKDFETGFEIKRGQRYLRLHVIEKLSEKMTASQKFEEATSEMVEAMSKVAEYIRKNEHLLPENPMVGITRTGLAQLSKKLGFTVTKAALPESVKRLFHKTSKGRHGVSLCFQTYDAIVNRFSSPSQADSTT